MQKLLGRLALANLHEYFRRVIIKFFLKKKLIRAKIVTSLVNWRHSGFSVDYANWNLGGLLPTIAT